MKEKWITSNKRTFKSERKKISSKTFHCKEHRDKDREVKRSTRRQTETYRRQCLQSRGRLEIPKNSIKSSEWCLENLQTIQVLWKTSIATFFHSSTVKMVRTLKTLTRTLDISVEEISVIKKQKAIRKMKYNNAEWVTILKLPKLEIKQNATNGVESHLF